MELCTDVIVSTVDRSKGQSRTPLEAMQTAHVSKCVQSIHVRLGVVIQESSRTTVSVWNSDSESSQVCVMYNA